LAVADSGLPSAKRVRRRRCTARAAGLAPQLE
jgi:hypothetical protein